MDNKKDKAEIKITIDPKGPYILRGGVSIFEFFIVDGKDGKTLQYEKGDKDWSVGNVTTLCRCGASKGKPHCDGSHLKFDWNPELTAMDDKFMDGAIEFKGNKYTLYDKRSLCVDARFCNMGAGVWSMIMDPQNDDESKLSVETTLLCPSGRLAIKDNATGEMLDSNIEQSVGLIEDTPMGVSGPIWVRGGIPIVTGVGDKIEHRNNITLCRCGASMNKPFCDGAHIQINFNNEKFGKSEIQKSKI